MWVITCRINSFRRFGGTCFHLRGDWSWFKRSCGSCIGIHMNDQPEDRGRTFLPNVETDLLYVIHGVRTRKLSFEKICILICSSMSVTRLNCEIWGSCSGVDGYSGPMWYDAVLLIGKWFLTFWRSLLPSNVTAPCPTKTWICRVNSAGISVTYYWA